MTDKHPPTTTEQEPLKKILERLRGNADEFSMTRWKGGGTYNKVSVEPPDVLAVLDQFTNLNTLSKDTELPMQLLLGLAHILSNSNNTQESAIGYILLTCHAELEHLTKFASDLQTMKVDYPVQDKTDEDEKEE